MTCVFLVCLRGILELTIVFYTTRPQVSRNNLTLYARVKESVAFLNDKPISVDIEAKM